jgi:hypothetical protein
MNDKARYMMGLSMLLVCSATSAAQLQFTLDGGVAPLSQGNWSGSAIAPSALHASFVLDTLSAGAATYTPYTYPNNSSQACLGHFSLTGLAVSNVSVQTDQGALWSANNLSSQVSGDNATGTCPGGFFATLGFSAGGKTLSWSFDPSPGISQADIESSADPLATLLLGFRQFPGTMSVTGDWGTLYAGPTATITALSTATPASVPATVPLPSSFVLFASGIVSLVCKARRREAARATAWRHCSFLC